MMTLKRFLKKVLATCGFRLVRISRPPSKCAHNIFTDQEFRSLVAQMDRGDFDFDEATQSKMIALWHRNPGPVPVPSLKTQAYASGDTVLINSIEQMEITYRLPYARAYEQAQEVEYLSLVEWAQTYGVEFDGRVVVDVGCGLGGLLNVVSLYNPSRLYGVECASSAIDWISNNRPHIVGIVADIESEEFRSVCNFEADVVFCTQVLEHLRYPERALENLLSVKGGGGVVIVTVPEGRSDTAFQHINFWSPESWRFFVERTVPNHAVSIDRSPSPNAPGGFDNVAIIR